MGGVRVLALPARRAGRRLRVVVAAHDRVRRSSQPKLAAAGRPALPPAPVPCHDPVHALASAVAAIACPDAAVSRETLRAELGVALADAVIDQVEISAKYAGYIGKQNDEVERLARYEHLALPADLDYSQVSALSFEVRQTLSRHRPETLGQASRMSGVTPAAVSLLLVHLKKGRFAGFADLAHAA